MKRYVAVQEPTCTWAVFDTLDDVPAEIGGAVLVGLERSAALDLAASCNEDRAERLKRARERGHLHLVGGTAA
ncbi:hypothetical protein ABUE31_05485 [Mesorhizobium sp. ZMM04-5]|uniref:Uncharacterized protein n=1 Tax=Mesorhizobium marinum TaxID=3228790 RepID=A0ABV3QWJ2_9HYPH